MKTMNFFSLQTDEMTLFEMNAVRGGTNGGDTQPVDEDILLRDPEPGDDDDDDAGQNN